MKKIIILISLIFISCSSSEEYEISGMDNISLTDSYKTYTFYLQSLGGHEIENASCQVDVKGVLLNADNGTLDSWNVEQTFSLYCRNDNDIIRCRNNVGGQLFFDSISADFLHNITKINTKCSANGVDVNKEGELWWQTI